MPSMPEGAIGTKSHTNPPDPNNPSKSTGTGTSNRDHISAEPSPAIISSSSNVTVHILARRFLGPMPENVTNSADVVEKRRRIREMRRKAVGAIMGHGDNEHAEGTFGTVDGRKGVRKVVHRIRVRRKNKHGDEVEEEVELDDSDDGDSDGTITGKIKSKAHIKKKTKRKDVWVGDSFDIGQEFYVPEGSRVDDSQGGGTTSGDEEIQSEEEDEDTTTSRPGASRKTTQETFVTARTNISNTNDSSSMIVNLEPERDQPQMRDDLPMPSGSSSLSAPALGHQNRDSQGSSIQPLISRLGLDGNGNGNEDTDHEEEARDLVTPVKKAPGLRNRFRSVVKQSPGGSTELNSIASPVQAKRAQTEPRARSKSVQFNANPVSQGEGGREPPRRGNKQAADPIEVLEREGEAVAGTSAGAAEEMAEEEEEEPPTVGQIIMRDRMLVRVGYHEKDGLGLFNEYVQRRDPCKRLDMFEEYIVVWRKGRVELYQDWTAPFRERIVGHKQLCFSIPLQPNRTSLSIFNPIDMTIALATSASRLEADVERMLRSKTTKHGAFKERVKQSRQFQWLKRGEKGTHVFIMKISERTRAADWFWELWRDMGGELPRRLDVQIPTLSTSVRLAIPQDDDEVGGKKTTDLLSPKMVVETCWEMLGDVYDREELARDTDVGLAWKTEDGRLDWLAFNTTVQGKSRDWGVLVGLARQDMSTSIELQARRARHQPIWARLEDGTVVQEPQGIEGFLIRLKTTTAAKSNVYVSTHDGNVFTSHINQAHPPLQPGRESSMPRDVFPELHSSHLDNEKERMRLFLRQATGCVDFRDIEEVALISELNGRDNQGSDSSDQDSRRFEVRLTNGDKPRFEAHSPEVAKEWVERLSRLTAYWKRRHRIDARERMEVAKVQASGATFMGGGSAGGSSDEMLAEIWDWCPLKGCRPITHAGRIYLKKSPFEKYRSRYVILSGGYLITFKIKKKQAFHERKKVFSLFGSYCYSGQMAHDELHEQADQDAFARHPRVYHDGLQSADGIADTTFCVRLARDTKTWTGNALYSWDQEGEAIPPLSKKAPGLLFFRARSSLERDRWVWAINAEKERMARSHVELEDRLRNEGNVPDD